MRSIRLAPNTGRATQLHARAVRATGGACVALAISVVALPLLQQSLARGRVEAQIEAMKPAVAKAEALRRAAVHPTAGAETVAAARAELGDVVRILAAVTTALPDDTFLISFSLNRRTICMEGASAAAARLITLLSAEPAVRNPHFAAPVTRSVSGRDAFSIQADARL